MNNELLKQCKDEVAKKHGHDSFQAMEENGFGIGLGELLGYADEAAELYSSRQREEDRKRIEDLTAVLSRVLYWDNGDLPENAIRDIKAALNP